MQDFPVLTLPALLSRSVEKYADLPAVAFVDETPLTYAEFDKRRMAIVAMLEKMDIKPGDRIALLSANMPNWGITYFSIVSMGAIVVPILPDFSSGEIENVLLHSEAKAIFISTSLKAKIEGLKPDTLQHRILIDDFSLLETTGKKIQFKEDAQPAKEYKVTEDDLAAIIYTSGTTGKSKGVMLTHKNISSNAVASRSIQEIVPGDRFLSVLPLSHTYE
ncbi:MAG: long-chain fatty acid--CoA ligase, partial [Bacteroidetes bacterium]